MSALPAPPPDNLYVLPIEQLKGRHFLIPAYQRGYRWTAQHVEQLLNDVAAFEPVTTEAFYCLQPIVVRQSGSQWEVIDGQQRLTTIWLILGLLPGGAATYSLDFATDARQQLSAGTLAAALAHATADPVPEAEATSLEASYIFGAAEAVAQWQAGKNPEYLAAFRHKLLHQTKVIWHETKADGGKAQEVFTRLNAGKIPLTDAELIKALLLMRRSTAYEAWQFELAAAWDGMEATLGQPDFAGWLRLPANPDGHPRLGWLLRLVEQHGNAPTSQPLALFQAVEKRLRVLPPLAKPAWTYWQTVAKVFQRLQSWHDDPAYYHRVGYLLAMGHHRQLEELLELAERQARPIFWAELNHRISELVEFDAAADPQTAWDELAYGDGDYHLRRILLLHNVATAEQARGLSGRFPFAAYRAESWSLEHLHPQNPAGEQATAATYQQWLRDWRTTLTAAPHALPDAAPVADDARAELAHRLEATQQALNDALKSDAGVPDDVLAQQLRQLRGEYLALFSDLSPDEEHALGNLALLTQAHNSALNNALFAQKRRKLLALARRDEVVLPATLQAFLKAYTHSPAYLNRWQRADSYDYRAAVETDIRQFLTAPFST